MNETHTYLGDGVYASHDGYQAKLETLEGQEIYLNAATYHALQAYMRTILEEAPHDLDHG